MSLLTTGARLEAEQVLVDPDWRCGVHVAPSIFGKDKGTVPQFLQDLRRSLARSVPRQIHLACLLHVRRWHSRRDRLGIQANR